MSQDEQERTEETPPGQEPPAPEAPAAGEAIQEEPAPEAPVTGESTQEGLGLEASPPAGVHRAIPAAAGGVSTEASGPPRREYGSARPERPRDGPPDRRRRFFGRRKVCAFCVEKVRAIDYKDPVKLRRYLSDRGRIEARRKTGTCAKHQRWLALALKRARHLALLPYTPTHIRESGMFASRR